MAPRGLTRDVVERISADRGEPDWMRRFRLAAFETFLAAPMPPIEDAERLERIVFDEVAYAAPPEEDQGGPAAAAAPAGPHGAAIGAQYESEEVYRRLREEWARQGVVFLGTDEALRVHPDLFREHFATAVPPEDGRFAALNAAVWSGGSFVYVPPGVRVEVPLQAWFRIDARHGGQLERSLIVVDEGAEVHYVEGCTAPVESRDALHASVVEIVVKRGARCRYTTLQNWSKNVWNLVAKRAIVGEEASAVWLDVDLGSRTNVKHPALLLAGRRARGDALAIAFASSGQRQDAGARVRHAAPHTESRVVVRAIARAGGRAALRAAIAVEPQARGARARSRCEALILDGRGAAPGAADTVRDVDVHCGEAAVDHAGSVERAPEDALFYLESRGVPEDEAAALLASGFIQPIARELPMEYAVELARLVQEGLGRG